MFYIHHCPTALLCKICLIWRYHFDIEAFHWTFWKIVYSMEITRAHSVPLSKEQETCNFYGKHCTWIFFLMFLGFWTRKLSSATGLRKKKIIWRKPPKTIFGEMLYLKICLQGIGVFVFLVVFPILVFRILDWETFIGCRADKKLKTTKN